MGKYVELNNQNFDDTIKSNSVVLVDFWATWCGPCRMLAPTIEQLAQEYEGKAIIAKVDVDENVELAKQFGIMSIPTIYFFKDGQVAQKMIGLSQKSEIASVLDKLI